MEFATRSDRHLEVEKRKVETLRRELQEARAELHEAAGRRGVEVFDDLVKENKKFALEKHVDGLDVEMLPSSAEVPPGYLLNCLSCKGRLYCQDIIELGLRLMGLELSAQQAQSVLRAFVEFQYPDKVEGIDYRIPDVRRFNEWRNYLGPLAHYVALSTVVTAERTHVLSDATTKRGYSVLQTVMRCEVTDPDTKELLVLDVPLKFEVCASGKAVDEAKQIRDALRSELLNGLQGSLVLVATSCTDNAARATSRELEKLKKKELDNLLLRAADEIEIDMHNNGDKYAAVIEAYRKLTPEQRKDALTLQELGCNGHTLNLVVDSCWKHTEKMVMKLNVEKNFAANVIQRFVCQKFNLRGSRSGEHALFNRCSALYVDVDVPKFIISLTKQFPSTVDEDADPRLQEKNSIDSYVRQDQATYRRMPGKLGSRQSFEVEVAAVIIHNTPVYSKYFDKYRECESANNLATTTAAHIKDKFVQAALRSRTFVCAGFNETARWFTHSECITVPMLGTIWKAIDDFLADDDFFESDQECPEPPPLTKLGDDILDALTARFPESLVDSVRNK